MLPTPPNRLRRGLERLHPAGKVLACLVLVGAVVALPRWEVNRLIWPAGALVGLWLGAGLPLRLLLQRLALALPFVLLAAISLPFLDSPDAQTVAQWGPVAITDTGLRTWTSVLAKAGVCLLALSLSAAVTPPHDLLAALRILRAPGLLVTVLSLTVRYLALLVEEAQRMRQARDARGVPATLRRRVQVAGAMIGALFVRSWERAERVGHAMTARGFTGSLPVLAQYQMRLADGLVLGLVVAASVGMVIA